MSPVSLDDFLKIKICVGTIISAEESFGLKKSSIILKIDFGPEIGVKKSSAQLRENYNCKDLINEQIIAVINFFPKQVGSLISEVLVLALPDDSNNPILVLPEKKIKNGMRLY